jgi:hypothetical protein
VPVAAFFVIVVLTIVGVFTAMPALHRRLLARRGAPPDNARASSRRLVVVFVAYWGGLLALATIGAAVGGSRTVIDVVTSVFVVGFFAILVWQAVQRRKSNP